MRFKLHVFICDGECVEESTHEGWMTVTQIAMERRPGCRYAVVEDVQGAFQVWDFFDDELVKWLADVEGQPEVRKFPDLDSAVSATVIRYPKGMWYAFFVL